jgi:hypothetical protein
MIKKSYSKVQIPDKRKDWLDERQKNMNNDVLILHRLGLRMEVIAKAIYDKYDVEMVTIRRNVDLKAIRKIKDLDIDVKNLLK